MSLHTLHNEHHQIYFCTITCYKWLPLFEESQAYHSVYRWFEHLKKDGCLVTGYVIMPNHFHALLYLSHSGTSLNKMVGEGKRFMAYDYARTLETKGYIPFGAPNKQYCARFAREVAEAGGAKFGLFKYTGQQNVNATLKRNK